MSLLLSLPVEAERYADRWTVRDPTGHERTSTDLLDAFEGLAEMQWMDITLGATFDAPPDAPRWARIWEYR